VLLGMCARHPLGGATGARPQQRGGWYRPPEPIPILTTQIPEEAIVADLVGIIWNELPAAAARVDHGAGLWHITLLCLILNNLYAAMLVHNRGGNQPFSVSAPFLDPLIVVQGRLGEVKCHP
jgi:hypothetical protein